MIVCLELSHELFIQKMFDINLYSVISAAYGPLRRNLRRNLVNEALSCSTMKVFWKVREWSIGRLMENLSNEATRSSGVVIVLQRFRTTLLCIVMWMCFGSKPDEETVLSVQGIMLELSRINWRPDEALPIAEFFYHRRWAWFAEKFVFLRKWRRSWFSREISNLNFILPRTI